MAKEDILIEPRLKRACGIDIHKDQLTACIMGDDLPKEFKESDTFTESLRGILEWLKAHGIKDVIIESTGIYWIPIYRLLEANAIKVYLVNPQHVKQIPGRKTDVKDSEWLCKLLLNGLIMPSYVPDQKQRQLRDMTRQREHYIRWRTRIHNRVLKILESNNIKLRSVISNMKTKTAQGIIKAISEGNITRAQVKDLCKGRAKAKWQQIAKAAEGTIDDTERFILRQLLEDFNHVEGQIGLLDSRIQSYAEQFYAKVVSQLDQFGGISQKAATQIISEIGDNLESFPSADHLAAWTGLVPANDQSAGKRRRRPLRKGNNYLKKTLVQVAWATVKRKNTYWQANFYWLRNRMSQKKAIIIIARKILLLVYGVLKEEISYQELDAEHFWESRKKLNRA